MSGISSQVSPADNPFEASPSEAPRSGLPDVVRTGDLHIDPRRRSARVGQTELDLTRLEFRLLYMLASRPGEVFSREELLLGLWPDSHVSRRSVDTLVKRLRRKLGVDADGGSLVLTVRGDGYKLLDRTPLDVSSALSN